MSPEKHARLIEVMAMVAADCETDTNAREGQALTGKNVAVWLGEMNALIAATANVVRAILEDAEPKP